MTVSDPAEVQAALEDVSALAGLIMVREVLARVDETCPCAVCAWLRATGTKAGKWHGTTDGYSNHDCRCDDCRTAWAAYTRKRRRERKQLHADGFGEFHHGANG